MLGEERKELSRFGPAIEIGEELCVRVCYSFFLFSTQNQVPQIIVGMGRVIYHAEALSVVIRTMLNKFPSIDINFKAKVLGVNLTRTYFFFKRKILFRFKNLSSFYLSAHVFSA